MFYSRSVNLYSFVLLTTGNYQHRTQMKKLVQMMRCVKEEDLIKALGICCHLLRSPRIYSEAQLGKIEINFFPRDCSYFVTLFNEYEQVLVIDINTICNPSCFLPFRLPWKILLEKC